MVSLTTLSAAQTPQRRIVGWIINNEWEGKWGKRSWRSLRHCTALTRKNCSDSRCSSGIQTRHLWNRYQMHYCMILLSFCVYNGEIRTLKLRNFGYHSNELSIVNTLIDLSYVVGSLMSEKSFVSVYHVYPIQNPSYKSRTNLNKWQYFNIGL